MKEIGLYIHIPFCISKCIYCDFLSGPADEETRTQYVNALCNEIITFAEFNKDRYIVKTVFLGGGTPSVLSEGLMERILKTVHDNFTMQKDCEITMECNPGTVDYGKLKLYRDNGVNRLSFGLQSVNNYELKALGRIHTFEDFIKSYEEAGRAGFTNINADLMSGLPGQTVKSFTDTLKTVISLDIPHISAYSLILEDGTPILDMYNKGIIALPDEDEEREIYYETGRILSDAGYNRYEISNYSKRGFECRHNIIYWQRGDYKGFGIGAASLIGEVRYTNTSDINGYIKDKITITDTEKLTVEDCMSEYMFLGLRMMEGVSIRDFNDCFGRTMEDVYGNITVKHIENGLLVKAGDRLKLTKKGIDISNYVFTDFLLT